MKRHALTLFGAAALALGALGCGGGGGGGTTCDVPALFTAKSCAITGCHSAMMPAANFDMVTAGWEMRMVGLAPPGGGPTMATSSLCANMGQTYLVAGSKPATGLFIDKLSKAPPQCGLKMPNIPLMDLSAAEIACVQEWANKLTVP